MTVRFDRVIRKGYEDDSLVYSLVLDDQGLYIVRTGNVGGLATDHGDVNVSADDVSEPTFVRQLVDEEARLDSEPLPVLVHSEHSAYVPIQQITNVQAAPEADPPTLALDTLSDHYDFVFMQASEDEVAGLVASLRARL